MSTGRESRGTGRDRDGTKSSVPRDLLVTKNRTSIFLMKKFGNFIKNLLFFDENKIRTLSKIVKILL